jgi:hypothetical protein
VVTAKKQILALLALLAESSGENVTEARLSFTASRLTDLDPEKVCAALSELLESARRFPTVAEIKAKMGIKEVTELDEARLVADRILEGVPKYGSVSGENRRSSAAIELAMGEACWTVIRRFGGWNLIVDLAGENMSGLRAQLRDAASTYLSTGIIDRGNIPRDPVPTFSVALTEVDKRFPEIREGNSQQLLEANKEEIKTQLQKLYKKREALMRLEAKKDD